MKKTYNFLLLLLACALLVLPGASAQEDSTASFILFDLDDCYANFNDGSNEDYSDMTGAVSNNSSCAQLEVVGGYLYRENPQTNTHSCTPGVENSPAMCVSVDSLCEYNRDSDKSIIIEVMVEPGESGVGGISSLSFYEQAPAMFSWIGGNSGPNNYPKYFSVRILNDGEEVYASTDNETEQNWNHREYPLMGDDFTVTEPTVFTIELTAYCPQMNFSQISVWDVDNIYIEGSCCAVEGGELTGGPYVFCVGDGITDNATGIVLEDNIGTNSQWVVTDTLGTILGLPPSPEVVDFDGAGPGVCLIWHLSYADSLSGVEMGGNAADIAGCFDLSNPVTVYRNEPAGGMLTGGPYEFCVGDGVADNATGIVLEDNIGTNSQWVVTDTLGTILGLPPSPEVVDFDGAGPGVCLIWHLSYADSLSGVEMGGNAADIAGCFDLSNPVTVYRNEPAGGVLTGGPYEFCVGDGIPDNATGIVLEDNIGTNSQWVVTDTLGTILGLPPSPEVVDFDGAGPGVCLIWHLSYADSLSGVEMGGNAADIAGCFDLSNPVTVYRNEPAGGVLTGGPYEFCVGDGVADNATGIVLEDNIGTNSQWVVTDTLGTILGLPPSPEVVDFDGAGPGVCLIWHLSYADSLSGVEMGGNAADIAGCFDLSNPVTVYRNEPAGGVLTGGPYEFCVGDGVADNATGIVLEDNIGTNSQWVVTDTLGTILGLPPSPEVVDFDGAGPGVCLIWHLSYADSLLGVEMGGNAADIAGCFDLSNPVTVYRNEPAGGVLTGGPYEFCAGDGIADNATGIVLEDNIGTNSQWVVTDTLGTILGLPPSPEVVDFDGAGPGVCLIWHLSYADSLSGVEMGGNAADISGCFDLSNPVTVYRNQPAGGVLTGGPYEFCVGDSEADTVADLTLTGNSGTNSQWIVTDTTGLILGLPPRPGAVDFDGAGPGICIIWHLSYEDSLNGLEMGMNAADLEGCFSLSNGISVKRETGDCTPGNSINSGEEFNVFPNPSSDFIYLTKDTGVDEDVTIEIFDTFGQLRLSQREIQIVGQLRMDVSDFGAGQYFVRMSSKTGYAVKTFVLVD